MARINGDDAFAGVIQTLPSTECVKLTAAWLITAKLYISSSRGTQGGDCPAPIRPYASIPRYLRYTVTTTSPRSAAQIELTRPAATIRPSLTAVDLRRSSAPRVRPHIPGNRSKPVAAEIRPGHYLAKLDEAESTPSLAANHVGERLHQSYELTGVLL